MPIPPYNLENLLRQFVNEEALEWLFFGEHVRDNAHVTQNCLSQWYSATFTVHDVSYKTAEHWKMARKANLFNDPTTFEHIIASQSPKAAKVLGRSVKNFSQSIWCEHKYQIVVNGNLHKFTQHPQLFEFLMNTGKCYLVQANPNDVIWGIGLSEDTPHLNDPTTWKGTNLLGFALMEVRHRLAAIEHFEPLENPLLPPWILYPDVDTSDMFWRMGLGEDCLICFIRWFEKLSSAQQTTYQAIYPKPTGWTLT